MNSFIDAIADFVANLHVFRCEPATHPLNLKVSVQTMMYWLLGTYIPSTGA
jgi:hypothetical protein